MKSIRSVRLNFKNWLLAAPLIGGCSGPNWSDAPQIRLAAQQVAADGGPITDCQTLCGGLTVNPGATLITCFPADGGSDIACEFTPGECKGRRPAGFKTAPPSQATSEVGAHWAFVAQLEAAAVHAFRRLAVELEAHGVALSLVRRARRAAQDEVRHARLTAEMAKHHRAQVAWGNPGLFEVRSLEEIAIENAVEGCVRETYGAVASLWEAEHAAEAATRTMLRGIARDECRHARLSWSVAGWLGARLSREARRRVAESRRSAVGALRRELKIEPCPDWRAEAGAPSAMQAGALLASMSRSLRLETHA
jgi:hypothetical protein